MFIKTFLFFHPTNPGVAKTANSYETNLEVQANNHYGHMEANRGGYPTDSETYGWLDCVSKKSGLPRWLLSITIFLSALAMIWLCCATTATAPEQRLTVQVCFYSCIYKWCSQNLCERCAKNLRFWIFCIDLVAK